MVEAVAVLEVRVAEVLEVEGAAVHDQVEDSLEAAEQGRLLGVHRHLTTRVVVLVVEQRDPQLRTITPVRVETRDPMSAEETSAPEIDQLLSRQIGRMSETARDHALLHCQALDPAVGKESDQARGSAIDQEQVLGKASRTGQGPVLVKVLPIDLAFRNNLLACQDWEQGRLVHDCQIKELGCKTVPRIDHRTFRIDKAI